MSPLLRFTAPFGFPGPNISVSLSLCVYFWVIPVVPSHKMVRLWGPSHQSLSSFSPPTYSGTVIILFLLLFLFLSSLLIFLFLLSSFIRARVPHTPVLSSESRARAHDGDRRCTLRQFPFFQCWG